MGGTFHLSEVNEATTSEKMLAQRINTDGVEAPRNSLELPTGTSGYYAMHNNIPYSFNLKQNTSKMDSHLHGTPVKKLIDEEMSKPKETRRNVPSVVARLMGMDLLPIDKKPTIEAEERRKKNARNSIPRKEKVRNGSTQSRPLIPKPVKQTKKYSLPHIRKGNSDEISYHLKLAKQQSREHPQENQLQKFKKDFEAWQASKVWKLSRSAQVDGNPRQWKDYQTLAQENLNMEKMARYANAMRNSSNRIPGVAQDFTSPATVETNTQEIAGLQHHGYRNKPFKLEEKEASTLMYRSETTDCEQFRQTHSDYKCDRSSVPTRIVILKPGLERSSDTEKSLLGSQEIVEEDGHIEDFLEEVKERLRLEIQANVRKDDRLTGGEFESPFRERPSFPKEIAQHISKHVRASVVEDVGTDLRRSKSTRSYINGAQFHGPGSPEFVNRETRKLLSERLRNVLRNDTDVDTHPVISGKTTSIPDSGQGSLRLMENIPKNRKKVSQWKYMEDDHGSKVRSFRNGKKNNGTLDSGEVSPRNLVRSLSTPVSGTAFAKLLLEDPHVSTGAHIRRKHEAADNVSVEVRKNRKERSSFRGKVSNLRHNLTLRGRFFGKRIQALEGSRVRQSESIKVSITAPTVLMNLGTQENSTEVPPSPASVCSNSDEDFFRPGGHPSPVSPLDIPATGDHPEPLAFREINSKILELRRQLDSLQRKDCEEEMPADDNEQEPEEDDLQSEAHIYLKDVLVVAGLYDGFSPLTSTVKCQVFEEVEEAYRRSAKEGEGAAEDIRESSAERRVLFDLLNESLSVMSRPIITRSRFMRGVLDPTTTAPRGKELLEDVWKMVHIYVCSPPDGSQSLDDMVATDLGTTPWSSSMTNDEIDAMGSELEWMIVGELIEETMMEMRC